MYSGRVSGAAGAPSASARVSSSAACSGREVVECLLGLLERDVAAANQRLGVQLRTERLASMRPYMSGWV